MVSCRTAILRWSHVPHAAILFSLVASCRRHHIDPYAYLREVLICIAAHPKNRMAELLPDGWNLARSRLAGDFVIQNGVSAPFFAPAS